MDDSQHMAVDNYALVTGRQYSPGDLVTVPLDALVFSTYQTPWTDLEAYARERCIYDPETNDELIHYVTGNWSLTEPPPIYLDILKDGVALVDGLHRATWHFLNGRSTIKAYLNR